MASGNVMDKDYIILYFTDGQYNPDFYFIIAWIALLWFLLDFIIWLELYDKNLHESYES